MSRSSSLTLVTVVFEPEIPLLALQARSLSRFVANGDFAKIIVIDNTARGMSIRATRNLLVAYGRWEAKVEILRPATIANLPPCRGWIGQQVLKLLVHEHVNSEFYLVLDAKNHWQRPTTQASFVNPDGRSRGALHGYRQHALRNSLVRVLEYLDVDSELWLDRFPVTHTPVVLSVDVVRQLVAGIAERSGRSFAEEFVRADLTEFFLYGGWIVATSGRLDQYIDGTVIRSSNVWPSGSSRSGFDHTIEEARRGDSPFLSIHRKALVKVDRYSAAVVADYWTELGLFESKRKALQFIATFKLRYVSSMSIRKISTKLASFRRD